MLSLSGFERMTAAAKAMSRSLGSLRRVLVAVAGIAMLASECIVLLYEERCPEVMSNICNAEVGRHEAPAGKSKTRLHLLLCYA